MNNEERILERAEEHTDKLDGYYTITEGEDGVYLAVKSPEGKGKAVTEPVVFEDLRSRQIDQYDKRAVMSAVREATGTPVKIAEPPEPEAEPEIQVMVARDKMEASLQIVIPRNSKGLLMEAVMEKIKQSGIEFGIDHEAVRKAFENPGIRVVCARGQKADDGKNAYIKYHVDTENKGRPAELENGKVDFKNLSIFTTVHEGDVLAEKIPPTPGAPGVDVLGQPVSAKPGKDMPYPIGKNVKLNDNLIVAAISGQLLISNGKVSVMPVIEIKEDVDLSTGNIDFVGNVVVRGSVQSGFTVKAGGDVEIGGNVSGGIIEGKNITVKMGIQGMHRGYIKASENVTAKFVENASIIAGSDVLVNDVVLHSNIKAGKKIIVEGRRGLIAGGTVMAGEEIRAKTAGTYMATITELEVGANPQLREEYQRLRKDIKKVEQNLDQTVKALNILKSMDQTKLPPEKKEMLLKMTKAQFHLVGQAESMRNRILEIELAFEEMRYGRIRVADAVYPGVKVVVGTLVKPIREQLKYVSFYVEDGEITIGSYK